MNYRKHTIERRGPNIFTFWKRKSYRARRDPGLKARSDQGWLYFSTAGEPGLQEEGVHLLIRWLPASLHLLGRQSQFPCLWSSSWAAFHPVHASHWLGLTEGYTLQCLALEPSCTTIARARGLGLWAPVVAEERAGGQVPGWVWLLCIESSRPSVPRRTWLHGWSSGVLVTRWGLNATPTTGETTWITCPVDEV